MKRSGFSSRRGFGGGTVDAWRTPAGRASSRWNCRECRANPDDGSEVRSEAIVMFIPEYVTTFHSSSQPERLEARSEVPAAKPPDLH